MAPPPLTPLLGGAIVRVRDTCNVYVLRSGRDAVAVDWGSGAVLDRLEELGVDRVTDVLVTHHHRDQIQGLARAAAHGARIWVPPVEEELIAGADRHWARRKVVNDYDLRQDRFTPIDAVPVTGSVAEYRIRAYGGVEAFTLPTPGHTAGSVTYLVELDGRRVAFTGDLVYGDGRVWSLAATQWSYSGIEGQAATVVSCGVLGDREPDLLLPSHGDPVEDPAGALASLRTRLQELLDLRRETPWDIEDMRRRPWAPITTHLLRSRPSFANSYALVSETGAALLIDCGYDVTTGLTPTTERSARRALLWPLDALRRDHGVERIEAIVPTHYHDDHVAGIELVRQVEGAEVWSPANVTPVLEDPDRYDLPCLWFEPIRVDRSLALGEAVRWHEYELTPYALPGHTLYAAGIAFEVDGRRVIATGDQQAPAFRHDGSDLLNYQYRNRFRFDDYVASAELYRSLRPELMISGHWPPHEVTEAQLDRLLADGRRLAELHRELLPLDDVDLGGEGFAARIEPYRSRARVGEPIELEVTVRNPFDRPEGAAVELVVAGDWAAAPPSQRVELPARREAVVRFALTPITRVERGLVAADVTVGGVAFGQQAEALVEVR